MVPDVEEVFQLLLCSAARVPVWAMVRVHDVGPTWFGREAMRNQ